MIVESDHPEIVRAVRQLAAIITAHDGMVAEDFIVRENAGHFSCAIAAHPGVPDRIVVSYPRSLSVPMERIQWSDDPNQLEPVGGLDTLDEPQSALLEQWLSIINSTDKIAGIREALPRFAVTQWGLRHHLADAGFPSMRRVPDPDEAKQVMITWHSGGGRPPRPAASNAADSQGLTSTTEPSRAGSERRLIPLKHFVNHDPEGARQHPVRDRTAVATSAHSGSSGTYENYGDLDALQLLVGFGYVDTRAPLVHSVPVEVEGRSWGKVVVEWRGTREGDKVRDVPHIERSADGIRIHHLTARPGNRSRIATLLAMVGQSAFGSESAGARRAAETVIDGIAEANVNYYDQLDRLVLEAQRRVPPDNTSAPGILADLAAVSLLQRERLARMWG